MSWDMLAPVGILLVILGLPVGVFLVFHGIRDGLLRKRILSRKNPESYSVGRQAVALGVLFIMLGLFFIISGTVGLIQGFG
jgi:formate-dependent nitrite reductase membrane component NrfD